MSKINKLTVKEESIIRSTFQHYNELTLQIYKNYIPPDFMNNQNELCGDFIRVYLILKGSLVNENPLTINHVLFIYINFYYKVLKDNNWIVTNLCKTNHIVPMMIIKFLNFFYPDDLISIDFSNIHNIVTNKMIQKLLHSIQSIVDKDVQLNIPDFAKLQDNKIINKIIKYWYQCKICKKEKHCFRWIIHEIVNKDLSFLLPTIALTIYHKPLNLSYLDFQKYEKQFKLNLTFPSYYMRSHPHDIVHREILDEIFFQKHFRIGLKLYIFGDIFQNTIVLSDAINGQSSDHIWPPETRLNGSIDSNDLERFSYSIGYTQLFFITSFTRLNFQAIKTVLPDILKCFGGKCHQQIDHWHYVLFTKLPHDIHQVSQRMTAESIKLNQNCINDFVNVEKVYSSFEKCVEYINSQIIEVDIDYINYNYSLTFFDAPIIEKITNIDDLQRYEIIEEVKKGVYLPAIPLRLIKDPMISAYSKFMKKHSNFHYYEEVKVISDGKELDANKYAKEISCGKYYVLDVSHQNIISPIFKRPPLLYFFHSVILIVGQKNVTDEIKNHIVTREYPWNNIEVIILSSNRP